MSDSNIKLKCDDLLPYVSSIVLDNGHSEKTGRTYHYIELTFSNGWRKRIFLNDDSLFAVGSFIDK
jgi:hypothetical protein